jgi:hypothetical protein
MKLASALPVPSTVEVIELPAATSLEDLVSAFEAKCHPGTVHKPHDVESI